MTLNDYQVKAHSTAVHGGTLAYPIGSLAEETGEVAEVWGNWCAIRSIGDTVQQGTKDKLLDEIGDVFWNAAEIATLLHIDFSLVFPPDTYTLDVTQDVTYYICNLAAKVGKLNGVWTKFIRKHNGTQPNVAAYPGGIQYPSDDEEQLYKNLAGALNNVCFALCGLTTVLGLDTNQILEHNVEKLAARKKNNTLGGQGSVERKE